MAGLSESYSSHAILVKEASTLTFGQDLRVVALYTVETLLYGLPEQTAAPTMNPEVTFPLPEPVQAQQSTFLPLKPEVPITPEPTLEAGATALEPNATSAEHPMVTLPCPETVHVQQPTIPSLDMELTITPESSLETGAKPC